MSTFRINQVLLISNDSAEYHLWKDFPYGFGRARGIRLYTPVCQSKLSRACSNARSCASKLTRSRPNCAYLVIKNRPADADQFFMAAPSGRA